jgi:hypothetical protein
MDTIPEALTTNTVGFISIGNLAQFIEAPVERLRPLVEHNYLRVLMANSEFEQTLVLRPGKRATEWLRNMFQPLKMRPFVPLKEAGKLWGITERKALKYCKLGKIPVQSDPVFGNLISFGALKSLARARGRYYKPKAFGRAALLRYYLSEIEGVRWKEPPPYSQELEDEIHRIARLKEPWRTVRSVELLLEFRDAKAVTDCWRRQGKVSAEVPAELLKTESLVDDLSRKIFGDVLWRDQGDIAG